MRKVGTSAFTLTEVVIAIGLFAFAILGVVFLLGAALNSAGQIQQDSAMATAVQSTSAAVQAFETNATSPAVLLFNQQGVVVSNLDQALYQMILTRVLLPGEPQTLEVWQGRVVGPLPSTNRITEIAVSRQPLQP